MTPKEKIIRDVLLQIKTDKPMCIPMGITGVNNKEVLAYLEYSGAKSTFDNYLDDFRCMGAVETNIPPYEDIKYYDAVGMATKLSDGNWVGWTYYSGQGEFAEQPEEVDWLDEAYELICIEKEVTLVVQEFSLAKGAR